MLERAAARGYIGHVATLSRACVNQLFEAGSASHTLLDADLQRYFRDVNVLRQHAAIQPNSGDEAFGRVLAGLDPSPRSSDLAYLRVSSASAISFLRTTSGRSSTTKWVASTVSRV